MLRIVGSAALLATTGMLLSCGERPELSYPDAAAARRAGAVERGWIPEWLPNSAHTIHEAHSVDTNQTMLAFSFRSEDAPDLNQRCRQIQSAALKAVPFSVDWWPDDVPPSMLVTDRHVYYECDGGSYAAVSVKNGELYYWRP
jgi:hypothetical protein